MWQSKRSFQDKPLDLSIQHGRVGQLVFNWDRLETFLITRDGPVTNKATNTKCHKMQRFSFLCTFWNIEGIFSILCKIKCDRPTDTWRSTGRSRSTCWPPLQYGNETLLKNLQTAWLVVGYLLLVWSHDHLWHTLVCTQKLRLIYSLSTYAKPELYS